MPDFDLELKFQPWHFIQINAAINRQLVGRACELLQVGPEDRVLDLFCGRVIYFGAWHARAREVVGVEGDASLVEWARHNAARNNAANAIFHAADLTAIRATARMGAGWLRAVLLDPPVPAR